MVNTWLKSLIEERLNRLELYVYNMGVPTFDSGSQYEEVETPEVEPLPTGESVTFCEEGNTGGWVQIDKSSLVIIER